MTYRLVPLAGGFYDDGVDEGPLSIADDLFYLLSADAAALDPWCRSQVLIQRIDDSMPMEAIPA